MTCKAILIGNAEYSNLSTLECCRDDVVAVKELLDATGKYAQIDVVENADANALKTRLRDVVNSTQETSELFFYYSGHGFQHETEFFLCCPNFDFRRPNETGLSSTELHTLLKLANADLVVKVLDACNSGTQLVKAEGGILPRSKEGFRNLIQISSCLDSQNSLTGDPLSLFTGKFRSAALRKTEGVVYYTDIVNTLRDDFLENEAQTPFFVSQHTGREQFVDDAGRLDRLRDKLEQQAPVTPNVTEPEGAASREPITPAKVLASAEAKLATANRVSEFVAAFFEELKRQLAANDYDGSFDAGFAEHSDYHEPTARGFIIRVLAGEKRPDNLVTAEITREVKKKRSPWAIGLSSAVLGRFADDEEVVETHDLTLNCSIERAQLRFILTPRFKSLQRITLVVSCAPSLEHCYVFEIATRHMLRDFEKFDSEGAELTRRWYKLGWNDGTEVLAAGMAARLREVVSAHVENVVNRLRDG